MLQTAGLQLRRAVRGRKDLGVCLIDIGGGTTDIAVWTQGAIRHTSVIPSPAIRSPTTSPWRCARRPARPRTSSASTVRAVATGRSAGNIEVAGGRRPPEPKLSRRRWPTSSSPGRGTVRAIQNELRHGFEEVLSSGIVLTGAPGDARDDRTGRGNLPHAGTLGSPSTGSLADVVQSPRFPPLSACCSEAQTQRKRARRSRKTGRQGCPSKGMKSWFVKNF